MIAFAFLGEGLVTGRSRDRPTGKSGSGGAPVFFDRPREALDGRTYSEQSVHLGRLDVGVLKLAMRSVLVRLGGIRGDARILHLLSAAPRIRRTSNAARDPICTRL
jgi:hypothetical protein